MAAEGYDEPAVKVTLSTIYTKLLEVDRKVDPLPAIVADQETRLRAVEVAVHDHASAVKAHTDAIAALQAAPKFGWASIVGDLRNWFALILACAAVWALIVK